MKYSYKFAAIQGCVGEILVMCMSYMYLQIVRPLIATLFPLQQRNTIQYHLREPDKELKASNWPQTPGPNPD